jgi:hypothetical protein
MNARQPAARGRQDRAALALAVAVAGGDGAAAEVGDLDAVAVPLR